jgi:hypothetical protein
MKIKTYQITFLPWISFNKVYKIGPILFWPYDLMKNHKITDKEVIIHLDKYFEQFINYEGKKVNTITICTFNDDYLKILNSTEIEMLNWAINSLIFSTLVPQIKNKILHQNYQLSIPNSDIFNKFTSNFFPGDNTMPILFEGRLDRGWKIGELCFQRPWTTSYSYGEPNEELVGIFNKFMHDFKNKDSKRLLQCIEWFKYAHRSNLNVSPFSKLLMMAIVYEIFFNLQDSYGKKNKFRKKLNDLFEDEEIKKEVRKEGENKEVELNLAGWWANDFYKLRNSIVHGDDINIKDLHYNSRISFLDVADLVMLRLIILKSYEKNFIDKEKINSIKRIINILNKICTQNNKENSKIKVKIMDLSYDFKTIYEVFNWI